MFLKEAEFKYNHKKFSNKNIIDYFIETCKYVYDVVGTDLYDISTIIKLTSDLKKLIKLFVFIKII